MHFQMHVKRNLIHLSSLYRIMSLTNNKMGGKGWIQDSGKGGGGSGYLLTTKTRAIRVHARNVFFLFMKFGGDPQDPPPPTGSAPGGTSVLCRRYHSCVLKHRSLSTSNDWQPLCN